MNKRLEVFEVYVDADWRSHETRDELIAAYCFFARTSQRANLRTNLGSVDKRPIPAWFSDAKFGIFICLQWQLSNVSPDAAQWWSYRC